MPILTLTEHHATKAYWESRGKLPYILDPGTRWKLVVNFTPRPLYSQGKSPCYPLNRRLGGPQSRAGEEKNIQPLPGLELRIIQPVYQPYTTELSRLLTLIILPIFNSSWVSSDNETGSKESF
jgi:hypothetical protein